VELEKRFAGIGKDQLDKWWNYYKKGFQVIQDLKRKFEEKDFSKWFSNLPQPLQDMKKMDDELQSQLELYQKMNQLQTDNILLAKYRIELEKQYGDDFETILLLYESFEDRLKRLNELKGMHEPGGGYREIDTSLVSVRGLAGQQGGGGISELININKQQYTEQYKAALHLWRIQGKLTDWGL
jgi:hypothetical protein